MVKELVQGDWAIFIHFLRGGDSTETLAAFHGCAVSPGWPWWI